MMNNIFKRLISYNLGLLFLAVGVVFSIESNLGVSPINSLPYVIAKYLNYDQGVITTIIFIIYILLQWLILKKNFKLFSLFQIVFASIFGWLVSFSINTLHFIPLPKTYFEQLIYCFISIILVAIGLLLYLAANILPQPAEGLMLAINTKLKIKFSNVKMAFDTCVVLLSIFISYLTMGNLSGIREGTIISAIFIGKTLGVLSKYLMKPLKNFLH